MTTSCVAERRDNAWLTGRRGEETAEVFLVERGWRIRARRFRARGGEIDLVAEDGDVLVFVEVKGGATESFGIPAERVDPRKQRRIATAAAAFLARYDLGGRVCRFDVVEVTAGPGEDRIRHIEDAFRLAGGGRGPRRG